MNTTRRIRAVLGIDKYHIPGILTRAQAIHSGLAADTVTYAAPSPSLPALLVLIQNLASSQQTALTRAKGSAAARNVQRDLLITGMESERMFVQSIADSMPSRAESIIENAGMLVGAFPVHSKALLTLRLGKQSGSLACDANVGLLIGTGAKKPNASRFFNWGYTIDGKTFVSVPPTPTGKTIIPNLTPLTMVGVRVNVNDSDGPGEWSQVVTILVR